MNEKSVINNAVFGDILDWFQFLESNDMLSSEDISQTDFFSVKRTIMLGTTATKNLEKLLLEQKDAIENILKSQPVSAVGPNFRQGYSIPCIACYVSKLLEAQVLENLSAMFDDRFEIEE
ncbi:9321_t:CDS:1 [Diversispora eburnea]|uniref:9321_t:CDS:1 n=1 Tax=Diversispora eburnea TaxID=1213867 RepID=A0A9N9FYP7_9GLOM|nr:9321_t:CDS:1 [Diversispora eburnea]